MRQLSGQDASYVYMDAPNAPMHIGAVTIYDPSTATGGKVRFKQILEHIEQRLHVASSFRRRLVRVPGDIDHPYWVEDDTFDLEYHVRHIALPAPGDWRQLCIQVARLHARGLDLAKPLWEFTIIEGLDNVEGLPPGCFAMVAKVHHSAIDGVSGADMSSAIHAASPDAPAPAPAEEWRGERLPGAGELLARSALNNSLYPMRWLQAAADSFEGFRRLGKGLADGALTAGPIGSAPKTVFNGPLSPHRVVGGCTFDLDAIKATRSRVPGSTVNDVTLAIVGGALRRYLIGRGELPDAPMTALAPISVRGEGERGSDGNLVSAMVVELGTDHADAVGRLQAVHASSTASKALTSAIGARTLTDYSNLMPASLAGLGVRAYLKLGLARFGRPPVNCVVTNVPGPRIPIYLAGARLVGYLGLGPIFDGVGLIHPVYSYEDRLSVSFVADRAMMPDPEHYAECLQASFDELAAGA